ncbi:ABC-type antimicrobial peptide transport system, ATPase component [Methanolobus tindarius DSM 2278]|uniref:ABC-type antimicrobial peptide transport system, ATPase component n=1 Tax=Methanolobus tindarius DSM 2278 TaxID=1090322 RepID=W9DS12_METTI|nr:ABC transporter ATP-binding protein [Methanolobus tindarius]ETA68548.1 ABC-type antimicrobial peptide transport system, ATPase component [Methanolobus tindarius DSM 2278]
MTGCNVQNPEIGNVIDIQGLKKSYFLGNQEVPILHGIDLCIKQGEFVAIMGPSGSGKSTLMNMIGCLDRPTSGKVMLMGKDTNAITDNELAELRGFEIGFVFQNFNLIPRLSAYENVLLPTYSNTKKGMDTSGRARDLLKLVGLDDRISHKPAELSGGQRQRVAIARSLINDPSLILADEPTGNLDSKTSVEIMDIFSDLHQKGRTIVMITHDPEMEQYVDRVVRIMDGNIGNN